LQSFIAKKAICKSKEILKEEESDLEQINDFG
jgi:hypothetical protein